MRRLPPVFSAASTVENRSGLLIVTSIAASIKTGSFFFAEALHAIADRWRRCHHKKNGKLFSFAEASLILWWQRLHAKAVPANKLPLPGYC